MGQTALYTIPLQILKGVWDKLLHSSRGWESAAFCTVWKNTDTSPGQRRSYPRLLCLGSLAKHSKALKLLHILYILRLNKFLARQVTDLKKLKYVTGGVQVQRMENAVNDTVDGRAAGCFAVTHVILITNLVCFGELWAL